MLNFQSKVHIPQSRREYGEGGGLFAITVVYAFEGSLFQSRGSEAGCMSVRIRAAVRNKNFFDMSFRASLLRTLMRGMETVGTHGFLIH